MALVADALLGEGGDDQGQLADALLVEADMVGNVLTDGVFSPSDAFHDALQVVDQEGGSGCGRFYARVADHVQDALVALVAYASDDGQRELGHVLGQHEGVETAQVGCGAAAP